MKIALSISYDVVRHGGGKDACRVISVRPYCESAVNKL
jgi:hypothetical protein